MHVLLPLHAMHMSTRMHAAPHPATHSPINIALASLGEDICLLFSIKCSRTSKGTSPFGSWFLFSTCVLPAVVAGGSGETSGGFGAMGGSMGTGLARLLILGDAAEGGGSSDACEAQLVARAPPWDKSGGCVREGCGRAQLASALQVEATAAVAAGGSACGWLRHRSSKPSRALNDLRPRPVLEDVIAAA